MRSDQNGQQVPTGNIQGLSGLLSAILTQASSIQAADNAVDGKANNLMAAALVVMALLGTQLRGDNGDWHILTISAMLVHIVTVCLVLHLTRAQASTGTVVDLTSHRDYFSKDDELLLVQLIEDADSANDANAVILDRKVRQLRLAGTIFLLGFTLGILSLFVFS